MDRRRPILFFFLAQLTELSAGMAADILRRRLAAVGLEYRRQRLKHKHFRKDRVARRSVEWATLFADLCQQKRKEKHKGH